MFIKKIFLILLLCRISVPALASDIEFEEYTVFDGNQGWGHGGITYRLACAAIMSDCPNGDLICGWLSGSGSEPATDNCFLIARSRDGGKSWSEPQVLVAAGQMASIVTNIHKTIDGKIVAFGARWPAEKEYTQWHYFKIESADDGFTWSPPQDFAVYGNHGYIGGGPLYLKDGRCLYVGGFFEKRDNPLTADAAALAKAENEQDAAAMKSDCEKKDSEKSGKFGTHLHGCCVYIAGSDCAVDFEKCGHIANRPLGLLEPTAVERDDGVIVMLMRAEWGGFLWRSESRDGGKSWSQAVPTDIPNPSCLPYLIKLPDGRIALIHNPAGGIVGRRGPRSPLSVWISDDDMNSWKVKQDIVTGGKSAYPSAIIYKQRLVFVYDKDRRYVKFVDIKLPNIQDEN